MPFKCRYRHRTSVIRRNKWFVCRFRKDVREAARVHHRREQSASWPSLVLLEDPGRRMYPEDTRVGSVSEIQLPSVPPGDENVRADLGPAGASRASRATNHLTHHHRASPPQANFGPPALLELSDSARESLAKHGDFGPEADQLSFFLELALVEEVKGTPSLDFETVRISRLDKLVADLTVCGEGPFNLAPRFVHDVVAAGKLERKWRARFRVDYLMIDEIRLRELATRWRTPAEPSRNESSSPHLWPTTAAVARPIVQPGREVTFGPGS